MITQARSEWSMVWTHVLFCFFFFLWWYQYHSWNTLLCRVFKLITVQNKLNSFSFSKNDHTDYWSQDFIKTFINITFHKLHKHYLLVISKLSLSSQIWQNFQDNWIQRSLFSKWRLMFRKVVTSVKHRQLDVNSHLIMPVFLTIMVIKFWLSWQFYESIVRETVCLFWNREIPAITHEMSFRPPEKSE